MARSGMRTEANTPASAPASGSRATQPWLLFVHQLPSTPSNLRVRTWRRMQQLGAIAVKQAVYVLPDSPAAREDFEWLKTEIEGAGGEASVFVAGSVDAWSDDALVEEFRRTRQEAYAALADEIAEATSALDAPPRRGRGQRPQPNRLLDGLRQRFTAIERLDFFGSAGRDGVLKLLAALEERTLDPARRRVAAGSSGNAVLESYRGRLWVTRPRPGVDRMSSAWLIRRFVDPGARFGFVADRDAVTGDAIPFDMFGVEFTHRGQLCTFEVLCETFRLQDPALTRVAAIVHDLDLKDARFGASEAGAIGLLIDGLQRAQADDQELLAAGMSLFEALYRGLAQATRASGPRPVARQPRDSSSGSTRQGAATRKGRRTGRTR
jgi:hypothetical protein